MNTSLLILITSIDSLTKVVDYVLHQENENQISWLLGEKVHIFCLNEKNINLKLTDSINVFFPIQQKKKNEKEEKIYFIYYLIFQSIN